MRAQLGLSGKIILWIISVNTYYATKYIILLVENFSQQRTQKLEKNIFIIHVLLKLNTLRA